MTDTDNLKKALLMIQKLKKRLKDQENQSFEPIAIIGMSCRLPQADNPDALWSMLCEGKNIISSIPDDRWDLLKGTDEPSKRDPNLAYKAGYLNDIDAFDSYFFAISPREALRMDPQQRILLEVAYASLEDAGLSLEAIAGSNMAVFSSLYASPYSHLQAIESEMDALLTPTGGAVSIAANRLSYLFDLHGPSLTLDTACSSSLIAIHLACLNLQAKRCDTALVNAININLLPSVHSTLAKATMLSPSGQCHTFDARADGYVQGEGAGSIVLKPLSKALRDKDRIHAVIAGSAVNQDGKTNGLTAPNGLQQEQLLRAAYQSAKVEPEQLSYIECHGTGTFLGDPIEIQALGNVVGKKRDPNKPCWISSVKTNIGHLEPAAGIISMIKTALILKKGQIPPHLNFSKPNPHIPFDRYALAIPQKREKLPRYGQAAIAGVSSFGFGGANAHIVLTEHLSHEEDLYSNSTQELFTLSAKDEKALNALIARWCDYLIKNPSANLAQICYNLHLRRSHFSNRLAIVSHSIDDLLEKLQHVENTNLGRQNKFPKPINDVNQLDITDLAQHYLNNDPIDWQSYEANRCYQHIDMPLYPWQHKSYWPDLNKMKQHSSSVQLEGSRYPLRGKRLSSPLETQQFEFVFDCNTLPEIHDTFGVLHAGYYLEMLGYAVKQLHQSSCFSIENLAFLSPLFVPDEKEVRVQLIIENSKSDTQTVYFYSHDSNETWIKHASATLLRSNNKAAHIEQQKPCTDAGSESLFYERITGMGMPAGDTIRWIEHYWLGKHDIYCQFRKAKASDRSEQFAMRMHPGIIDACIQTLFLMLPEDINKPYIASQIGKIVFYDIPDGQLSIYSVLKNFNPKDGSMQGEWYLFNKDRQLIAECKQLNLSQLNDRIQIEKISAIQSQFQLDCSLAYQDCKDQLLSFLCEQFALIFSMPKKDINIHCSLLDLGMDSLMAMAVIRILESNLNINYSLQTLIKGPSILELSEQILADKSIIDKQSSTTHRTVKNSSWIANRKIQTNARLRLFCFPYGGGGASIYREWQQNFPDWIEVCPIQLPGRENRMDEQPLADIHGLVKLLADNLNPLFDLPFAFFGHSFGSLISFELTRYLRRQGLPQPLHFFASAYPNPSLPSSSLNHLLDKLRQMNINLFDINQKAIEQMDDDQLSNLTQVFKDNGIVDYSDERINKSIIQVLLPIFIADMKIVKNYDYQQEAPLNMKATVFLGEQDTWVTPKEHLGWPEHFSKQCEFQAFNQGHLFIRDEAIRRKAIKIMTQTLTSYQELEIEAYI